MPGTRIRTIKRTNEHAQFGCIRAQKAATSGTSAACVKYSLRDVTKYPALDVLYQSHIQYCMRSVWYGS